MGTTLTTLKTGHAAFTLVVAIEGYPYLLTDGSATAVATAWAGTDYAANTPLTGLEVELQNRQSITPWSSLSGGGSGNATITVYADATDRIGIDVGRTNAGPETYLTSTISRTATSIPVYATTNFSSTGEAYIGNECFEYSAIAAQSFTASKRGKYSPFGTESSHAANPRFAPHHRAGFVDYSTNVEPAVTQYRRSWQGAIVGIYLHRVSNPLLGTLDTRAQAQCIYAGVLDEAGDDPDANATIFKCVPFAERIRSTVLFRDQFKGIAYEGMWVESASAPSFTASDFLGGSNRTATPLRVVASGASGPNQMNAGYYGPLALVTIINDWLASEVLATRLWGSYELQFFSGSDNLQLAFKASGSGTVKFTIKFPGAIARFLGITDSTNSPQLSNNYDLTGSYPAGAAIAIVGLQFPVMRIFIGSSSITQPKILLQSSAGIALDQKNFMPPGYGGSYSGYPTVCLFQLWDGTLFAGALQAAPAGYGAAYEIVAFSVLSDIAPPEPGGPPLEIKQIICLSGTAETILNGLFFSTGTSAYNDATWDTLGFGIGGGFPWGVLGQTFKDSLAMSASRQAHMSVWITKPTVLKELLDSDLVILGLYLVWKNGGFQFTDFAMPTVSTAVLALTEANKAEQAKDQASQKSPMVLTTEWAKQILKIEWGYDFVKDQYTRPPYIIEDRTAIDNSGQDIVEGSLRARNLDVSDVPGAVDRLRNRLGFFTQPFHKITRSISLSEFEDLAPFDHVTVTDDSARDPLSGSRRTTSRPALLLSHASDFGGTKRGMSGEVVLWLAPVNRAAVYSPTAVMDETVNTGGFTRGYASGTKTIRTKSHEHTDTTGSLDASFFAAGDKINIMEIDPLNLSSPDLNTDTIVSVSTTDIVLTAGFTPNALKTYRIYSQAFTTAQATQQVNAYQADDADALIQNSAPPFRYELPKPAVATAETIAKRAELLPTAAYGDGVARDTGHERALIRAINQAIDYKTAHQTPTLSRVVAGTSSITWALAHIRMVFVGIQFPGIVTRSLSVSPFMRSTNGSTASARVTLSPGRPTDTSLSNVILPAGSVSQTFTTTSTTFVTPTAQLLNLGAIKLSGMAFLLIELSANAECMGLGKALETVRS